jgi:hypothetical protein
MNLTTSKQTEYFHYSFEGLTVIEPGQQLAFKLTIQPLKPFYLQAVHWQLPEALNSPVPFLDVNQDLTPSIPFQKDILFTSLTGKEGFGEIKFKFNYKTGGTNIIEQEEVIWISVFERKVAGDKQLDDDLRNRLVSVVNFRPQNGHIFLADYASFFDDFLNITVPPHVVKFLSEDFALPNEGLPLDHEQYIRIITGSLTFYGMERLELLFEEDCNESDDRFDFQEATEVINPKI